MNIIYIIKNVLHKKINVLHKKIYVFESLANLIKQIKKAKVQFSFFPLCTMNKIGSKLQHVLLCLVVSIQN